MICWERSRGGWPVARIDVITRRMWPAVLGYFSVFHGKVIGVG